MNHERRGSLPLPPLLLLQGSRASLADVKTVGLADRQTNGRGSGAGNQREKIPAVVGDRETS